MAPLTLKKKDPIVPGRGLPCPETCSEGLRGRVNRRSGGLKQRDKNKKGYIACVGGGEVADSSTACASLSCRNLRGHDRARSGVVGLCFTLANLVVHVNSGELGFEGQH